MKSFVAILATLALLRGGIEFGEGSLTPLTAVMTDIPGTDITVTTGAGAKYLAVGVFDFSVNATGNTGNGVLSIDGVDQSIRATYGVDPAGFRHGGTVPGIWVGTLTGGMHTFKLRAARSGAATVDCPGAWLALLLLEAA